jgi:hypothetical protein
MTLAMTAFQQAAVAALGAHPELQILTGIYDGPPPRAAFPYLSISGGAESDWSTKTEMGRELRFAVTLWDDAGEALRLHELMSEVQIVIAGLSRTLPGWRIASLIFTRSLIARDPAGPWAGLVEHRVRMLAV